MKTTEMYIEQAIIGSLVFVAIWIFYMGIHCPWYLMNNNWLSKDSYNFVDVTVVVTISYLIGMVYDRVADTLLERIDRHYRLCFAHKQLTKKIKHDKSYALEAGEDLYPEDQLRVYIMKNNEAVEYTSYLRSRMRLLRALTTLLPIYIVIVALYVSTDVYEPESSIILWIYGAWFLFFVYTLVFISNSVGGEDNCWKQPRTDEIEKFIKYINKFKKSESDDLEFKYIDVTKPESDGECSSEVKIPGKLGNYYHDPAYYGYGLILVFCVWLLWSGGADTEEYMSITIIGLLLTLLCGWSWLRVSDTFMKFLVDFEKNDPKKTESNES